MLAAELRLLLLRPLISEKVCPKHKLEVFLSNPLVPIDNNPTEAAIRPFDIGRSNWIFADTLKGADASTNLYSLVESARSMVYSHTPTTNPKTINTKAIKTPE
ncbi:MAG: IS66 family transposase [Oligoflexus sp.]